MASEPVYGDGKICYIEIPALDIRQSSEFYGNCFGWNIRRDDTGNVTFDDAVGQVSGLWITGRPPMREPGIIISIMVNSIEATVAKIRQHGGQYVKPDYETTEKIAWFTDPAGNLFGLYQHQAQ